MLTELTLVINILSAVQINTVVKTKLLNLTSPYALSNKRMTSDFIDNMNSPDLRVYPI